MIQMGTSNTIHATAAFPLWKRLQNALSSTHLWLCKHTGLRTNPSSAKYWLNLSNTKKMQGAVRINWGNQCIMSTNKLNNFSQSHLFPWLPILHRDDPFLRGYSSGIRMPGSEFWVRGLLCLWFCAYLLQLRVNADVRCLVQN